MVARSKDDFVDSTFTIRRYLQTPAPGDVDSVDSQTKDDNHIAKWVEEDAKFKQ